MWTAVKLEAPAGALKRYIAYTPSGQQLLSRWPVHSDFDNENTRIWEGNSITRLLGRRGSPKSDSENKELVHAVTVGLQRGR
jgi:hypothetical protein